MNFFYINKNTIVRKHSVHGFCRNATNEIKKDEIVFVVGGLARHLSEHKWYKGLLIDKDLVIDLPEDEEYQGYINHSCEPNVYIDGQVVFRALRNIEAHEYLTIDYGTFMLTKKNPIDPCNCGTKNCRGKVTGADYKFLNLPLSWYAQKEKSNV